MHVNLDHGGGWWVGTKNEGRMGGLTRKWWTLVVKVEITDPRGSVATRWSCGGFVFSSYLLCLVLYVDLDHGGGRWVGAKNEGRAGNLTKMAGWNRKSRNLPIRGIRSDPVAPRRIRIFFLFVVFGVACRCGSWRRALGPCRKRRTDGEIIPK